MSRHAKRAWLWSLFLCMSLSVSAAAQERPLWGDIAAGPFGVGFKRLWELDRTRVWPRSTTIESADGEIGRPVRIDVWYPASCSSTERMQLRGYVEIPSPSEPFDDLVFLTHRWDEYSYRGLAPDSTVYDRLMDTETAACRDASPAPGRFPLVVYSAGWFNRAPDNTILAEFLASHGYIVATVPQTNPGLWTFDFTSDAASVESQVRDLELAIGTLIEDPMVDRRHTVSMGYSTGGDVALLLQIRNPLVDAVVGLDASWSLGPDNDVLDSPFFVPEQHDVPVLALRRPSPGAGSDEVLDLLTSAPRIIVEVPEADHGSFGDDNIQRHFLGDRRPEYQSAHAAVAKTVLEFLKSMVGSVAGLDGEALASRLRSLGVEPVYRPPTGSVEGALR